MPTLNLPSLNLTGLEEGLDNKTTLNNILDTLQLYRKELNFLLMNLDSDNMPLVSEVIDQNTKDVEDIFMSVSNIKGDVASLQIQADGIIARVSDAEGNIASLVITAEGIQTQVTNNKGDISTLTQTALGIQTQVSNQAGQISTLTQTAQGIQTQVIDLSNSTSSSITQLSTSIELKVSKVDYNGTEIVSLIEQTPEYIKLQANKIELDGITHVNGELNIGGYNQAHTNIRFGGGPTISGYFTTSGNAGAYLTFSATEIDFMNADIRNFKGGNPGAIEAYYEANKCYIDFSGSRLTIRNSGGSIEGYITLD